MGGALHQVRVGRALARRSTEGRGGPGMRFGVLATDYDGTIGDDRGVDPAVRVALQELRDQGTLIILVSGRILYDLRRVVRDLRVFDAIVAENGAVLGFPTGEHTVTLAPPAPLAFLAALQQERIPYDVGACVVETSASYSQRILALIERLELPLVVLFNRGRLMVLPQGVSKASGLHAALRMLRRSEHNAVGIGNAENDHALLHACELGVAVAWGSPALQAAADAVIPGEGPADVAPYLHALAAGGRMPTAHLGRHRVRLGHSARGEPVSLAVAGRNVLIAGDSRSGKSWVAGRLSEQLILQRYGLCVIDPEGDHRLLATLPGVISLGGDDTPPPLAEVTLALRHPDLSVVVDLSQVERGQKQAYVQGLLPRLAALRQRTGLPQRIVLDEAHQFLFGPDAGELVDAEAGGYTLVTYRLQELRAGIRSACPVLLTTRLTDPRQVELLCALRGAAQTRTAWRETLADLRLGEAVLLPGAGDASPELTRFWLAPRLTGHVRHQAKYVDVELPEARAFVFTREGSPTGERARTMRELAARVRTVPDDVLKAHLERGDLSRWVGDVFADEILAAQFRTLEALSPYEALTDLREALSRLVEDRYLRSDEPSNQWSGETAEEESAILPLGDPGPRLREAAA